MKLVYERVGKIIYARHFGQLSPRWIVKVLD
jgi:hypothetical protein